LDFISKIGLKFAFLRQIRGKDTDNLEKRKVFLNQL